MIRTVSFTADKNLCISCGICAAVCPEKCITFREDGGRYLPVVREDSCGKCGKCFSVCPGKGHDYTSLGSGWKVIHGLDSALGIFTARTKNPEILRNAVSGGIITEIISGILHNEGGGGYDGAFVVCGNNYTELLKSEKVTSPSELHDSQKSRYVIIFQRMHRIHHQSH